MNVMRVKKIIYYLFHPSYYFRQKKWKRRNIDNFTTISPSSNNESAIVVGKGTYGNIVAFNDSYERTLRIGNYCSIANNVAFLVARDHRISTVSSYPFKQMMNYAQDSDYYDAISKGDIVVDDDVWIGYNATILSGVHIAQGAIIAAGAVVTGDVPPYAIVGGVPARVIKYRFEKPVIDYLLTLDYGELTREMVTKNIDALYQPIDQMQLEDVIELYDWFPKKKHRKTLGEKT